MYVRTEAPPALPYVDKLKVLGVHAYFCFAQNVARPQVLPAPKSVAIDVEKVIRMFVWRCQFFTTTI